MRTRLCIVCLLVATGCAQTPRHYVDGIAVPSVRSHNVTIGNNISLTGKFGIGKLGPLIICDGVDFYLLPKVATIGKGFDQFEGRVVTVTGALHHVKHYEFVGWDRYMCRPFDHFYFDAETVKLSLKQ